MIDLLCPICGTLRDTAGMCQCDLALAVDTGAVLDRVLERHLNPSAYAPADPRTQADEFDTYRTFALDVARHLATPGAEDMADKLTTADLPTLLDLVRVDYGNGRAAGDVARLEQCKVDVARVLGMDERRLPEWDDLVGRVRDFTGLGASIHKAAPAEWFSFDRTNGFELHDTEAEAIRACESSIDFQRDEARQHDGWDEDEAGSICLGIVTQRARFIREDPVDEDPEYVGGDYEMTEIAHRTDDPLPSAIEAAREEGRRAGLNEAATLIDDDDTFDVAAELRAYINLDAMGVGARKQVIGIGEAAIAYAVKAIRAHAATPTRGEPAKEPSDV